MEDVSKVPTEQTDQPTVETETTTEIKNPSAVLAKNKELLAIHSKDKQEIEALREFKKNQELSEQQRQGDYEGVITSLREELTDLKGKRKKDLEGQAYNTFESAIKTAATNEGCVNADKLIRLMTPDQVKSVQIMQDEGTFNVHGDDVKRLIDTLKEDHKDIGLFRNSQPTINTVTSNFNTGGAKTLSQMSKDELKDYARNNF